MESVKFGARLRYWAWLFVAVFLLTISKMSNAAITDGKFGINQIFDVQYNWSGDTLNASNFIAPYNKNFQTVTTTSGQYFQFFDSTTNPGKHGLKLMNSDGSQHSIVHDYGDITALGSGAIFYIGSGFFGNVITTAQGYSYGSSASFTNMDTSVTGEDLNNYTYASSTPLASGETAAPPPAPAPACNPCSPNTNNANLGFESGTTQNWTISNGTGTEKTSAWSSNGEGVQTSKGMANYSPDGQKSWTVTPYGTYMLAIQAGGGSPNFDPAMISLGLNATQITEIKNYLNGLGGNSTPTNAAWAKRSVTLEAGKTYVIAWQYMSTDYVPFNDGSMMTLTHATDASKVPTLNNNTKNYALLGFTNPGTGNYATDSYGSTGWQLATITVPVTGDYVLGFASFNLGDTALSPILFVDDLQGETYLNGTTFGPIAPNSGSNAPTTGGTPAPACPNNSTCSDASFNANTGFANRANIWSQQTGNRVIIEQVGNYNTATIQQSGSKNYVEIDLTGSNNSTTVTQTTSNAANYIEALITGNSNTVNLIQNGSGGTRGIMAIVNNNLNNLTVDQSGTGNHYAEVNLSGSNKTVDVTQSGTAGHMVKIELTGSATSITTTQSGSTQQFYSITHNCAQASCAAISVTQGQ
jgi:hypothetical protein